jgi:hypothetical protein
VFTRVAVGRARVVREVRAAAPLMGALAAPVTARGPWLTAVLNDGVAHRSRARPVAVVVEAHRQGRPEGVAFLTLRRRAATTVVSLLGDGTGPVPGGSPPWRLLARDERTADRLARGIHDLVAGLRGPWTLRLAGLPLGDPTAAALAARLPTAVHANARSARLVDALDEIGPVMRSRDPRALERELPALLARLEGRRTRDFLRAAARLHAATGELELAVVPGDGRPRAALLTLLDGTARWPWWGFADGDGLRTEMGAPLVSLTVPGTGWPALSAGPGLRSAALSRRSAAH